MPKPFFLARPSGLFVRILVSLDLRARLGARFIVRRLYATPGDATRLAAAHMAAALSETFEQVRRVVMADFDFKDILDKARRGQLRDLTLNDVTLNDGTRLGKGGNQYPGRLGAIRLDAQLQERSESPHQLPYPLRLIHSLCRAAPREPEAVPEMRERGLKRFAERANR